jgi:hypothetical protein
MLDHEADTNADCAAVFFVCLAMATCAQIVWDVPLGVTGPLCFLLAMWFVRPSVEPPVKEAKKPSDKLSPFREL